MAREPDAAPKGPKNPHDRVFKALFSAPDVALPILRAALPKTLGDAIDPGSLEPGPTGFVNDELEEDFRDLLFSARVRGKHTLFYLLEHQRRVDPLMPLRLLRYVLKIWDWWLARHPRARTLPAVIPVVVHQGKEPWRGPRSLADLIDLPGDVCDSVSRFMPALHIALEDLGPRKPVTLAREYPGPALVRTALAFLRAAIDPSEDLIVLIRGAEGALRELMAQAGGGERLRVVLRYTVRARPDLDVRAMTDELRRVAGPEAGEIMKSTADQLIEKGHQEGLRELLALQLEERFGKLDSATSARLNGGSADDLRRWARQILTAVRIEDIFPTKGGRGSGRPRKR